MSASATAAWRSLLAPAIAAAIGFAILIGLGIWQLERKVWKEGLIAAIESHARGEATDPPSPSTWPDWRAADGEYRRVRLTGTFLNEGEVLVHGIAEARRGQGVFGFYVFTPLRRGDGTIVFVNRGFVPVELKDAARRPDGQIAGPATVTGLVRAPETRGAFVPANDAARREWFVRDLRDMAAADKLERVAPFYVDADATANPGGFPLGGQTRLVLPNDHLNYAFTWFGLALTLAGVFAVFARRRLQSENAARGAAPDANLSHAEVAAGGGPRSTHNNGASFEAPLRGAPQDEEGGSYRRERGVAGDVMATGQTSER